MRSVLPGLVLALLLPAAALAQLPGLAPGAMTQPPRGPADVRVNNLCEMPVTFYLRWQNADAGHEWTRSRWVFEPGSARLMQGNGAPLRVERPQAWIHATRPDGSLLIESPFMASFEHQGAELRFEPILLRPVGGYDIVFCAGAAAPAAPAKK